MLIPLEVEAELAGGRLSEAERMRVKRRGARAAGWAAATTRVEVGGRGWSNIEQVLVHEELGRNTNAIWWNMDGGYNVLSEGTPEQIERYLLPTLRGELADAYAVTERDAGSDAGAIAGTAERTAGGWRLQAEKWFVTSGDVADYFIVMVNVVRGRRGAADAVSGRPGPARDRDGGRPAVHPQLPARPSHHPVRLRAGGRCGAGRAGDGGQWGRACRTSGSWRSASTSPRGAWGRCAGFWRRRWTGRWSAQQFGSRIFDFQGISFPLADSATDCLAARLLIYNVATRRTTRRSTQAGAPPRQLAKLFAGEAAYRCADRAVQCFGGRGYMRTNVAERFLRELRVDRIWEGTSEIQRLIIARGLERRGVDALLDVTG